MPQPITVPEGTDVDQLKNLLDIQKTPDRVFSRKANARCVGSRTGKGIYEFFAFLFEMNERLGVNEKMTDEEIRRQVGKEFPTRRIVQRLEGKSTTGRTTINQLRLRYNRGELTGGIVPSIQSVRYDINGKAADGRTGRDMRLTARELQKLKKESYRVHIRQKGIKDGLETKTAMGCTNED